MTQDTWRDLASWLHTCHKEFPALATFGERLLSTPIRVRKGLLTCIRVQISPTPSHRLYERVAESLHTPYMLFDRLLPGKAPPRYTTGFETLSIVDSYVSSPVVSGLLSVMVREFPYYDYSDIPHVIEELISKELRSALAGHPNARLLYSSFLSDTPLLYRLNHNIPISHAQEEIHFRLNLIKGIAHSFHARSLTYAYTC